MSFAAIILIRLLFAVCMIFIIGYVFGNFSKKPVLTTITKFASILAIVLFISANVLLFRFGGWQPRTSNGNYNCEQHRDSTLIK